MKGKTLTIKKIILVTLILSFSFCFSQIEEIKKIDSVYDVKTAQIPVKNKTSQKYWKVATEINTQRISEYDKILKDAYENDSKEFPEFKSQEEDKIIEYKNGGIGRFRNDMSNNIDLFEHPFLPNLVGMTLKSELKFVIDENGKIKNVEAVGENDAFNTLCKIALYKTEGNWIPAQKDGKNIKSSFKFPIVTQI
ncbi:energy transducer TonB [Kaistella sp. 97-N-M2]|uniref:energy transducer TonB n=1 Tax=Kaistella sp. 97-N-M2 TaxID=2908645 RepID=UPI001F231D6F|nr:energy transducer TonB [Kaistella sp. 97-N-M2]UJF30230.1 energy transducer TonB [Kaistella sp. 97-N-M2]